jgi:sortase A
MPAPRLRRTLATGFLALGASLFAWGLYLPAKAGLAQVLLQRAWARSRAAAGAAVRPWPWAQTWPVARLTSDTGADFIVLAGAQGAALAFGPGWVDTTAPPADDRGNTVLAGHRDTSFRFLGRLRRGDALWLESTAGRRRYVVRDSRVVDLAEVAVMAATAARTLTLITCYPFDAVQPGGRLRYVVSAEADDAIRPAGAVSCAPCQTSAFSTQSSSTSPSPSSSSASCCASSP